MTGLACHTLAPRPVRGLVDADAFAGILHAPLLPACGPGLRTATSLVEFVRSLGVTVRGLDECTCVHLVVTRLGVTVHGHMRLGVTVHGHTGPATGRVTLAGHRTSWLSHWDREEAVVASRDRGNSGSWWSQFHPPAHALFAGSHQAVPQPVRDPCTAGCRYGVCFFGCWRHRCLALLLRCHPQPPLLVRLRMCPLRVRFLPLVLPLQLARPVDMSALGSLPAL